MAAQSMFSPRLWSLRTTSSIALPAQSNFSQSSQRFFFFCAENFTSSSNLLRVFKSSATAVVRTQRWSLSLSSRRLPLPLTVPADRTHDESRARERWGRMVAASRSQISANPSAIDRTGKEPGQESQFLPNFLATVFTFHYWAGGGGGGLSFKLVWRLAFNIFGD